MRCNERRIRGDLTAFAGGRAADGHYLVGGALREAPDPYSSLTLLAPLTRHLSRCVHRDRVGVSACRSFASPNDAWRSLHRPSNARKEVRERVNR